MRRSKKGLSKLDGPKTQTWKGAIEIDTSKRTNAQDRAWSEFWKDARAEAERRLAARN